MYEARLRELNPSVAQISYDVADLYAYVDSFSDMAVMVLNPAARAYMPYSKEWIRAQLFEHLKRIATARGR